jgi:phage-related protein
VVLDLNGKRPIVVVFFQTGAGNEPVRTWLQGLPKDERKAIGEDILTAQFAWPVGKPLVDSFGGGLWEIRSNLKGKIARMLFIFHDEEIVLLHGFIKKDRKTPKPDLDLAKKRMKQYLQGHE